MSLQWKTSSGEIMPIEDMCDRHLLTALRFVRGVRARIGSGSSNNESRKWNAYFDAMVEECTNRGLAVPEKIPVIVATKRRAPMPPSYSTPTRLLRKEEP